MIKTEIRKYMIAILGLLTSAVFLQAADTPLATQLKTITGASKAKIVYARCDSSHARDFPTTDFWTDELLVGVNSDVGVEETLQTAKGNYQNPLITHEGNRVVYTTLVSQYSGTTYIVDWTKNATPRKVANGMTACLWIDPVTGKEYAIYAKGHGLYESDGNSICKIDLDDTTKSSLVFHQQPTVVNWLRISADANAFAGCMGPFGGGGAPLEVDDATGHFLAGNPEGCWPTMPYDNSYRLVKTTADHNAWEVMGPDFTDPVPLVTAVARFSELRMASYIPTMFLTVINAADADNGTGDIEIVKTDTSLVKVISEAKVATGNLHHADLWANSLPAISVIQRPARTIPGQINVPVKYYTVSGRKITEISTNAANGRIPVLPAGIYIKVEGSGIGHASRIVSNAK